MPAPLESCVQKRIENSFGLFRPGGLASQAKNIGVVVLPGQRRGGYISDQRRPHARHLVGGDAHADARRANQDA